jgi:restriction system protein
MEHFMRIDQLLLIMLHALPWWVPPMLLLGVLTPLFKTPGFKGWLGELLLHHYLRIGLDRKRYRFFHNLILPTPDGSTQVDHVVVSIHGIFVIETKNFGGWIFGSERDRMWTQKFGRRSYPFQNPLRQNYKHVRALAELTSVDDDALFSLVAFVGDSTFKTPMPENVTRAGGCLAYIRARRDLLLSQAEVDAAIDRIGSGRVVPSRTANAAHARHVRELVAQRKASHARSAETAGAAKPVVFAASPSPEPAAAATATRVEPQLPVEPPAAAQVAEPAVPACPDCGGALGDYTYRSGIRAGQIFRGCVRFPNCSYRVHLPASASAASAALPA